MASNPPIANQSLVDAAAELEIEMMSDMYRRMSNACQQKCIPSHFREGDLSKGEAVCLDRCVAKYFDIYERLGRKLSQISVQDEQLLKQNLQQQQK